MAEDASEFVFALIAKVSSTIIWLISLLPKTKTNRYTGRMERYLIRLMVLLLSKATPKFSDASSQLSGFNGLRVGNGLLNRLCEQGHLIGSISEEFLLV